MPTACRGLNAIEGISYAGTLSGSPFGSGKVALCGTGTSVSGERRVFKFTIIASFAKGKFTGKGTWDVPRGGFRNGRFNIVSGTRAYKRITGRDLKIAAEDGLQKFRFAGRVRF